MGADSLHDRIDAIISAAAGGEPGTRSDDAEFLRRVSLDLAGQIPMSAEVRSFLDDPSPDKRTELIDRLLESPQYSQRMTDLFNIMLIERRSKHAEWLKFLRDSFASNKPWDQMTREILAPQADEESTRGSALFYTARLEHIGQNPPDVPGLVRDVGRLFLGVDVQCAQCHDHLTVDDYKQVDYQGLYAFVSTVTLRQDVKFPAVSETPLNQKIAFKSVFGGEEKKTGPRLPGGTEIELPDIRKGDEYLVPPDKKLKTPGVLKFSPIGRLAEALPTADNAAFTKNIVNRLWWMMMGRGLVDPLDLHHTSNPPSHPELLQLLAQEMAEHHFDIKWFLKELALTQVYQRSGVLTNEEADRVALTSYRFALERPLTPSQLLASLLRATGETPASDKEMDALRDRFDKAFASPPKEPEVAVTPTVKGALFLSNDSVVLNWFEPRSGNTVERLCKMDDVSSIVDEAYLSFLARLPNDEERRDGVRLLESASGRERRIGYLAWALASSTEFFVNH